MRNGDYIDVYYTVEVLSTLGDLLRASAAQTLDRHNAAFLQFLINLQEEAKGRIRLLAPYTPMPLPSEGVGLFAGPHVLSGRKEQIVKSDFVIVGATRKGFSDSWLRSELQFAVDDEVAIRRAKIVVVSIDGEPPESELLRDREWVNLTDDTRSAAKVVIEWILKRDQSPIADFELSKIIAGRSVIQVARAVDAALIAQLSANSTLLYRVSPRRFEEIVAELFAGFGYEVELTSMTRDGGRDIIAISHGVVQAKYLVECKRWAADHPVSIGVVKQLHSTKIAEGATKAILATTSRFTRPALLFFENHRWELEPRDHAGIMDWIREYNRLRSE